MKAAKLIATLLVAGMLFTGCGLKDSQAIIKINDTTITQGQFDKLLDKQIALSPFAKMGLGDIKEQKDGIMYLMTSRAVVTQLIISELLDQEAKARGIKVSNKDVDEAIAKIIEKVGGKDQLSAILKENKVTTAQFKKDIKTQVKLQKLARSAGNIKVTDKEVKDYYDKNIKKFTHGDQVRAKHILISANPFQIQQEIAEASKKDMSDKEMDAAILAKMNEKKALAEKISQELQSDSSKFSAYAQKYSDDKGSAARGGDLGFFSKEMMVPEFSKASFEAKPNAVSKPVQSQFGYHIIMVTDRRAAGVEPFEKVKANLKEGMSNEKELQAIDKISQAARKKANIVFVDKQYDPEVISKKLMEQIEKAKESSEKADMKGKAKK